MAIQELTKTPYNQTHHNNTTHHYNNNKAGGVGIQSPATTTSPFIGHWGWTSAANLLTMMSLYPSQQEVADDDHKIIKKKNSMDDSDHHHHNSKQDLFVVNDDNDVEDVEQTTPVMMVVTTKTTTMKKTKMMPRTMTMMTRNNLIADSSTNNINSMNDWTDDTSSMSSRSFSSLSSRGIPPATGSAGDAENVNHTNCRTGNVVIIDQFPSKLKSCLEQKPTRISNDLKEDANNLSKNQDSDDADAEKAIMTTSTTTTMRRKSDDDSQHNNNSNQRGLHDTTAVNENNKDKGAATSIVISPAMKIILLAALSIQGATYLLLARHTRSVQPANGDVMYDIHDLVLMSEVIKFVVCCIAEHWSMRANGGGNLWSSIQMNIIYRPYDAMKSSIPAIIYVIQNSLTYVALSNLSAPLYVAMIQGKIFVTACVSVLLLRRIYRIRQWTALITLTLGLVMILLEQERNNRLTRGNDEDGGNENELGQRSVEGITDDLIHYEAVDVSADKEELTLSDSSPGGSDVGNVGSFGVGAMAVLAACFCSAFASVYMEKVMKKDDGTSLYMRNIQLAFFGIIVATSQSIAAYHRINEEIMMDTADSRSSEQQQYEREYMKLENGIDDDFTTSLDAMQQRRTEVEDNAADEEAPLQPIRFLHGFTIAVWMTCILQAAGGLLIATIMKYLDSVMKGLAIAVSVVLITFITWFFVNDDDLEGGSQEVAMTPTFLMGATIIMTSVFFFGNPIPKALSNIFGC